jgi:hypothetical protein
MFFFLSHLAALVRYFLEAIQKAQYNELLLCNLKFKFLRADWWIAWLRVMVLSLDHIVMEEK